jgi:carbamoyltransferase
MTPVVLGLNCSHDAAACLAVDGRVVCAVAEERLNRKKHWRGFPALAIERCLAEAAHAGGPVEPDVVVINQLPPGDCERHVLRRFPRMTADRLIVNPSHHLLHASYAVMFAPGQPQVVLVVDGSGYSYAEHRARQSPLLGPEPHRHDLWEALTAYYVDGDGQMSLLIKDWGEWRDTATLRFPSFGHMYSLAATHIFGSWTHAGKVMGLAPYGDPSWRADRPIVTCGTDGVRIDTDWILDVPRIPHTEHFEDDEVARNLAAKVQAELETGMSHLAALLHTRTGCDTIALSGGVALNSVFNGRLMRDGQFTRVIVAPAAQDSGTAIGAAAFGYRLATNRTLAFGAHEEFLGPRYEDADLASALERCQDLSVERPADPAEAAAEDLAAGRIIGWFEGASEFGPRALGHRSILADPRGASVKRELNANIKFRESFRPYAAAVLREHCAEWFEDDFDSPHMLAVSRIRAARAAAVPAVVHVDQTCRLQTVSPAYDGSLRRIIEAFHRRTGVPMVLNTSLNVLGEPIAETPRDAVDCVVRSGLEILYCGGYRIAKRRELRALVDDWNVIASPSNEFRLVAEYARNADGIRLTRSWAEQGGRRVPLSELDRRILLESGGHARLAEIVARCSDVSPADIASRVELLCRHGVLCLTRPHAAAGT